MSKLATSTLFLTLLPMAAMLQKDAIFRRLFFSKDGEIYQFINCLYDKPKDIPWGKRYEEVYEEFSTERPPSDNINADLPYFLVKVPTLINQQNLEEIPFETHPDTINKGTYIFRIILDLNYPG